MAATHSLPPNGSAVGNLAPRNETRFMLHDVLAARLETLFASLIEHARLYLVKLSMWSPSFNWSYAPTISFISSYSPSSQFLSFFPLPFWFSLPCPSLFTVYPFAFIKRKFRLSCVAGSFISKRILKTFFVTAQEAKQQQRNKFLNFFIFFLIFSKIELIEGKKLSRFVKWGHHFPPFFFFFFFCGGDCTIRKFQIFFLNKKEKRKIGNIADAYFFSKTLNFFLFWKL